MSNGNFGNMNETELLTQVKGECSAEVNLIQMIEKKKNTMQLQLLESFPKSQLYLRSALCYNFYRKQKYFSDGVHNISTEKLGLFGEYIVILPTSDYSKKVLAWFLVFSHLTELGVVFVIEFNPEFIIYFPNNMYCLFISCLSELIVLFKT